MSLAGTGGLGTFVGLTAFVPTFALTCLAIWNGLMDGDAFPSDWLDPLPISGSCTAFFATIVTALLSSSRACSGGRRRAGRSDTRGLAFIGDTGSDFLPGSDSLARGGCGIDIVSTFTVESFRYVPALFFFFLASATLVKE